MTVEQIISVLQSAGVVGVLVIVLGGGARGLWVWGYQHRAAIADKDEQITEKQAEVTEWKTLALRLLSTTEKAVAERVP